MNLLSHHGVRCLRTSTRSLSSPFHHRSLLLSLNHNHTPNLPIQNPPQRLSSSTATRIIHNKLVNPPASTLPAPLVIPVRNPDQKAVFYWFSVGKAYIGFYKDGLRAIWANYKLSRDLQNALGGTTSPHDAARSGQWSRREYQLFVRTREDTSLVPRFAILLFICAELTPFVVMILPQMVPRTCWYPKQVAKARNSLEERRARSFELVAQRQGVEAQAEEPELAALQSHQIRHLGQTLGLSGPIWALIGDKPAPLLRRKLETRLQYLEVDDMLIERDGGVREMEMEEVRISCQERGLDVLDRDDSQLRGVLLAWLKARKSLSYTTLLLTRPSVWARIK